jgi:hypothetical protein
VKNPDEEEDEEKSEDSYSNSDDDNDVKKEKEALKVLKMFPEVCAEQLLNGNSIELMDGDTSFIYKKWISAILDSLKDKMRDRYNATKGFVTSIMDLQSSGKLTLLNTQYNLRLAVSAGRCAKGIFMLPVILSN